MWTFSRSDYLHIFLIFLQADNDVPDESYIEEEEAINAPSAIYLFPDRLREKRSESNQGQGSSFAHICTEGCVVGVGVVVYWVPDWRFRSGSGSGYPSAKMPVSGQLMVWIWNPGSSQSWVQLFSNIVITVAITANFNF